MKKRIGIGVALFALSLGGLTFLLNKNNDKDLVEAAALTNNGYDDGEYKYYDGSYYDSIGDANVNAGGTQLLSALCSKIKKSSQYGYDNLLSLYHTSDVYPNDYDGTDPLTGNVYPTTGNPSEYRGMIWDTYGDTKFVPGGPKENASYKKVGDGYNREHTVPQSWFSKSAIPKSDPHHVLPTDGYVNNLRGNYPYGEVSGTIKTYTNGFGGTGTGKTFGGTSPGTVFEPVDAYKGDLARGVLYMAVAYYDFSTSFSSAEGSKCFTRSKNKNLLSQYYIDLLTKWSAEDPVSQKEIDRNNDIYSGTNAYGNRNPFIDHPNWAYKIWGGTEYTWSQQQSTDPKVNSVSVSPSTLTLTLGEVTTGNLTANVSVSNGAPTTVNWSSSDPSVATVSNSGVVTAVAKGTATITATSTFNTAKSGYCTVTVKEQGGPTPQPVGDGTITITGESSGLNTTDGVQHINVDGFLFSGQLKQYSGTALWFTSGSGYIYNTTSLGRIDSITINYKSGGSATAYQWISLGDSELSTHSTDITNGISYENSPGGSSHTFTPTGDFGYFNLSVTHKNLQATSIIIEYSSGGGSEEPTVSGFSIESYPDKLTYDEGDYFDPTGLVLDVSFSDDSHVSISYDILHQADFTFEPSLNTPLTTSDESVTISYCDFNYELEIMVNGDLTLQSISVKTPPTKVSYESGELLDPTGLELYLHYLNSDVEFVYEGQSYFAFNPSLDTPLTTDIISVTVEVFDKSTSFEISVHDSDSTDYDIIGEGRYYIYVTENDVDYALNGVSCTSSTPNAVNISGSSYTLNAFNFVSKGTNLYEISITVNNTKYYLVDDTISASGSNTSIRITNNPNSNLITRYWEITEVTGGYQFKTNTTGTTYRHLAFYTDNSSKFDWRGYTSTNNGNQVIKVLKEGHEINSVASSIITLPCDNGVTPPSTSIWNAISSGYSAVKNTVEKALFTNASANQSGSTIQRAAAKYDYIVGKYGSNTYSDFANRNPAPIANGYYYQNSSNTNIYIIIIVISSAIGISLAGVLLLKKKKRIK